MLLKTHLNRTNLLLGLGLSFLGIIVPCLQIILAYIYFRKGHLWSRVLNAHMSKPSLLKAMENIQHEMFTLRQLFSSRVFI